jgi:vacuolar-type H+-ATPase subunit E/Vma4
LRSESLSETSPISEILDISEPDGLAGFKRALLEQHRKRHIALKWAADEDLANIIMARRLEVEGIVHSIRLGNEAKLRDGTRENQRRARLKKREYESELIEVFFEKIESALRLRLEEFRRSPEYGRAMEALAVEARELLGGGPAVALVEKGEGVFLRSLDLEVMEELVDCWGGLVMLSEGVDKNGPLVDNTFKTRWKRLYPSFALLLCKNFPRGKEQNKHV